MLAMFDYYMPGYDYKKKTARQLTQQFAHLAYIRQEEAKAKAAMFGM